MPPHAAALRELAPAARSHLSIQQGAKVHLIPVGDIAYLKAELKYVAVRAGNRDYLIEESLTHLEREFAGRFVRIHRSCLVAKAFISGFERVNEEGGESHW